jgi:hypothetical protein
MRTSALVVAAVLPCTASQWSEPDAERQVLVDLGRVRGADRRQRWIKAVDLRPVSGLTGISRSGPSLRGRVCRGPEPGIPRQIGESFGLHARFYVHAPATADPSANDLAEDGSAVST